MTAPDDAAGTSASTTPGPAPRHAPGPTSTPRPGAAGGAAPTRRAVVTTAAATLTALAATAAVGTTALTRASAPTTSYHDARPGDVVTLGTLLQDAGPGAASTPVQWLVLDRVEDRLLLLAVDVLAARPYHAAALATVTWADSDLRAWLHATLLPTLLTPAEQALVIPTTHPNEDQEPTGTDGGPDTTDTLFALSQTEATAYLSTTLQQATTGQAYPTAQAAAQGLYTDGSGHTTWWLRSPGADPYTAQYVSTDGSPHTAGSYTDTARGVRPALWLDARAQETQP